jgi:hypothetical protein
MAQWPETLIEHDVRSRSKPDVTARRRHDRFAPDSRHIGSNGRSMRSPFTHKVPPLAYPAGSNSPPDEVIWQDLLQAICYSFGCIKRRADALANLPNLGKVDSRKGMRPLRQRNGSCELSALLG